ncbi:MAG TPA: hypothetical protein DEQ50_02730 [Lactobacillus sp.]|nr:hypothetical protein [Lactobacillus sp.]
MIMWLITIFMGFMVYYLFKNKSKGWGSLFVFLTIFCLLISIGISADKDDSNSNKSSKNKTEKVATKKKEKSKPTANATSSKPKSKDNEDAKVKATKKANDQKNFDDYKNALTTLPDQSNGALTNAYVDNDSGNTVLVLSDDALSLSSNELKSVCKSAWDLGIKMSSSYMPGDSSVGDASKYITIEDNTGNRLAHTSLFGSFKYDGE